MKRAGLALLTLILATLCGCGGSERIVVGSKNFSEQVLLGEIVAQQIERRTALTVDRRLNLGGTLICDQAIRSGGLDLYVEYTGTALTAILGREPTRDPAEALRQVREAYQAFGVRWLDPLGFNNTFAMLVRGETARRLGIETLSEARPHVAGWRPGFGYEFKERKDGYDGLVAEYGFEFSQAPRFMEIGLLYRALAENQIDLAAGNSTDGLISALDLTVLRDDRHYFPPYDAAILVRGATLAKHPGLEAALSELSGSISDEKMREMNSEVDSAGSSVKEVARRFLEGLKASPATGG